MLAGNDFIEESRTDNIDVVGSHDATGEEIDGIGPEGFVEALGIVFEVEFIPKVTP